MDYKNFELQDFLNDDSFVQWALTGKDDAYWQHVLLVSPLQKGLIEKARGIVCQLRDEEENRTLELNEEDVLRRILREIELQDSVFEWPVKRRWSAGWLKWAAAVFIFAGIGWMLWNGRFPQETSYGDLVSRAKNRYEMTEKVNKSLNPVRIRLEDGTVVTLQKNSRLSYPLHFGRDSRETFLSGEAFFEVARNPDKPFYVYSNELVTRVLGTSFVVKSFDSERIASVDVRIGQVSVFNPKHMGVDRGEANGVVLLPNQKAVFDRKKEFLSKRLSDRPVPLRPQAGDQRTRFEEVPVGQVLAELEALYGIKIIYNEEILASCIISTVFGSESLNDKLDLICQTIGATHKEIDAQIIIESTGCL
ncbi:FecR domain-containing protein [Dyadobacter sp. CY261]|uniref:FecR family protein n=1 Tax=Dyadobacter sp. CY261 TaxID=2907203 RepID=UPI001F25EE28|nr:FecR domain-containing protein [Dyadobacter sp. CY261]MCF0072785.1 FecR domain-containing protein [Dyadobacter sp. CY261]